MLFSMLGKSMRYFLALSFLILVVPASAQKGALSQEEIIERTREAFRTAKTKEEVEGVTLWCRDAINSLSFKDYERLMLQSIKLMEANQLEDANALLKRANTVKEIYDNLGKMVCQKQ